MINHRIRACVCPITCDTNTLNMQIVDGLRFGLHENFRANMVLPPQINYVDLSDSINYICVRNSLEQLFENATIDKMNQRFTVMSMPIFG